MGELKRSFGLGMRERFVLIAVACYAGTLVILAGAPELDQALVLGALEWLVAAIGGAIIGDTARPSGRSQAAFGVTAVATE